MANSLRVHTALCATLVFLLQSQPAPAAPWLPLGLGTRWEYRGVAGAHQVETITGTRVIHGRTVSVKQYAEGTNAGLENYWLLDVDGSVLLAGFNNPSAALAYAYEPPIRMLPVPPAVGPGASVQTTIHDLFTDAALYVYYLQYDVSEHVQLALPAGSFDAFGVGQAIMLPISQFGGGRTLALDGRTLAPSDKSIFLVNTTDWYAEGVGDVQYISDDRYQLVSFGLPTPTARTSWTAIKHLYH
jgi:hypothetical protein